MAGHGPGIRDGECVGEVGGEADLSLPEAIRIVFIQPIHQPTESKVKRELCLEMRNKLF